MNDLLTDFESFFVGKELVTEVYKDIMPTEPNNLMSVYEYEGDSPSPQIAGAVRSIQIVVRDESSVKARTKAKEAYKLLDTEDGIISLTDARWGVIILKGPPFRLKTDEQNRVYYAFNLSITTYID